MSKSGKGGNGPLLPWPRSPFPAGLHYGIVEEHSVGRSGVSHPISETDHHHLQEELRISRWL